MAKVWEPTQSATCPATVPSDPTLTAIHSLHIYAEGSLQAQIEAWLRDAAPAGEGGEHVRALIAPHAGYQYCGHVMAHAYKRIDPSRV
jgi:predicted class III extradiol MEMO1 family dioxygenase